jgi:DNA mismatch repair ATPase MutS
MQNASAGRNLIALSGHQTWLRHGSFARGIKTKTTIQVEDLPQGMLLETKTQEPLPIAPAVIYPTVIQQARNNMRKFQNCVLLTRVGGFYELYFEQAEEFGPLLNLKVGKKSTAVGPVPMVRLHLLWSEDVLTCQAGFPFFQLDRFLRTLILELNQAVAIAEEFPNSPAQKAKSGGLLFDRRVARVVTPGTLVDEKFIDPYENNFLLAIYSSSDLEDLSGRADGHGNLPIDGDASENMPADVGLAWVDLSTGELFTQQAPNSGLSSAIARINAKETIVNGNSSETHQKRIRDSVTPSSLAIWDHTAKATSTEWSALLDTATAESSGGHFSDLENSAARLLLDYVKDRLQGLSARLQPPIQWHGAENMSIDANTMKGLEILETSREAISGGKGSLLHSLRRTVSSGGARLLRSRLSSPSTSLAIINHRLDLVQCFIECKAYREKLIGLLKTTFDTQRLVQKFSLGRGDADDLVGLYKTIAATRGIKSLLQNLQDGLDQVNGEQKLRTSLAKIANQISLEGVDVLASRIAKAVDEEGLLEHHRSEEAQAAATLEIAREIISTKGDGEDLEALPRTAKGKAASPSIRYPDGLQPDSWRMRKTANSILAELHQKLEGLLDQKIKLEKTLQAELKASSLTLRWTPGQGHICHVKGQKDVKSSMENFPSARNAGTSKSTRSFYHSSWTKLGSRIDQHKLRIVAEEDSLFNDLREAVVQNLVRLRRNAVVLDEIDVACASAKLAEEERLVRPILTDGTSHHVVGGRHATVKIGLEEQGRAFVSNDCSIGATAHIWLITGPNMAGKSTFLRQNALISILAQVGLFVPAAYAEIGIVDHVFTRIGSADNLYRDQSTFMVEMLESAQILRTATPRSLVIMDEVGRGTTPEDGAAVAFACLHHLYHINRCRTLFATHFHVLADMTRDWERLERYCTDIAEDEKGNFHYDYRLRSGVNRQSHALKVARLAGMPSAAIDVARNVLEGLPHPSIAPPPRVAAAG